MTPEEQAREQIDAQLAASGWVVQSKDKINLAAAQGVAVGELSFASGEPDYTLFVDGRAIGTVEAKPAGHSLMGVEEQSTKYVTGLPTGLPAWDNPLPFCYEATGDTPKTLIAAFRNSVHPRIAVTVDMIATGTDIKPLEKKATVSFERLLDAAALGTTEGAAVESLA
jgi:type I site-specific restriction endonuclease